jgi:hypothetical protein
MIDSSLICWAALPHEQDMQWFVSKIAGPRRLRLLGRTTETYVSQSFAAVPQIYPWLSSFVWTRSSRPPCLAPWLFTTGAWQAPFRLWGWDGTRGPGTHLAGESGPELSQSDERSRALIQVRGAGEGEIRADSGTRSQTRGSDGRQSVDSLDFLLSSPNPKSPEAEGSNHILSFSHTIQKPGVWTSFSPFVHGELAAKPNHQWSPRFIYALIAAVLPPPVLEYRHPSRQSCLTARLLDYDYRIIGRATTDYRYPHFSPLYGVDHTAAPKQQPAIALFFRSRLTLGLF